MTGLSSAADSASQTKGPAQAQAEKPILCSAADSAFFPLLQEMILSVRDKPQGRTLAIGILDLGLEDAQRQWLASTRCQVVAPGWDVDFPEREVSPQWLQAMVSRPFLPRHFPDHDVYAWLDADTWVQDYGALQGYFDVAARLPDRVAITLELDRAYFLQFVEDSHPDKVRHRLAYSIFYGEDLGTRLAALPIANVGAFAASARCPLWDVWQREVAANLQKSNVMFVEQVSFNFLLHNGTVAAHFMPSRLNWLATLKVPLLDVTSGLLSEPYYPWTPIGILHLTGLTKSTPMRIHGTDGSEQRRLLRYAEWRPSPDNRDHDTTSSHVSEESLVD